MNWKRVLRIAVCLVLVCSLIIGISPIKAEAFATELMVTGVAAAGAVGLVYLALAGGAVYVPSGLSTFEAVGTAFTEYMYQWGSTAEQLEENDQFFGGLTLYGGNPEDDGDDDVDRKVRPLDWIRRGAALFTAAAILGQSVFVEKKEVPAPDGYAYYNGVRLPIHGYEVNDQCDSVFIYRKGSFYYAVECGSGKASVYGYDDYYLFGYTSTCWVKKMDTNSIIDEYRVTLSPSQFDSRNDQEIIWSSCDLEYVFGGLFMSGSEPCSSFVQEEEIEPNSFVTAVKDQLSSGELSANDLVIPDINYANLIGPDGSLITGITDALERLDKGIITHEEFMEMVAVPVPVPDPVPDPSEDPSEPSSPDIVTPSTPDVDIEIDPDTLANTNAQTFLENLSNVITTPFKWIWGKIETTFTRLLNPEMWLDPLPEIVLAPAKWIWGKIEPIPGQIMEAVTDAATEVKEAVQSLVVPDKDYLTDKVNALCAEFAFADAIVRTAQAMHLGLANITTEPPVIYIDLGSARWGYDIGGKVPFIDMRWYAEYKPTADALISAFLWICFVWRMLIHLPGILSGASGIFVLGPVPSTQTAPIGSNSAGLQLVPNGSPSPGYHEVLSYQEMLDNFFDREIEDWLPGDYERYKAHPPSREQLIEWGYNRFYVED